MRIAFFSDTFLPQVNGVSNTLNKLREYMRYKGVEYKFFVPGDVSQHCSRGDLITFQSLDFFLYPECKIAFPDFHQVRKVLNDFQPDLIHITTPFPIGLMGLKYARKFGIPLVSSYHTDFPAYLKYYNLNFLEKTAWTYIKWFHSFPTINFCPSKDTLEQLKDQGIQNLEIWSRGIDSSKFSPSYKDTSIRTKYDIKDHEALLLYVGRLAPEKDLMVLIQAVEILKQYNLKFKLLLVGDGPLRNELELKNHPDIIFAGYKEGEELQRIYASSDLFVFPSSSETYGNVVLEAMASGIPVVAPYSGGVKENLKHLHNGVSFEVGNPLEMAKAIRMLMEDEMLRKRLGEGARKHSESKDWESIFDSLFERYESLIGVSPEHKGNLSA